MQVITTNPALTNSRLLVVGAGGIGCELLKNLVSLGFPYIEVVDLDVIELSNLNRQLLFNQTHIGQSKAITACKVLGQFYPKRRLIPHQDNIKSPKFDVSFYKQFSLVLNALDNLDARYHVNKMCVASNVPLFDSGTHGYDGNTCLYYPPITQCYACEPKPRPTTYPICTIRGIPDKMVHCIVWGKELFKLLFGSRSNSVLYEDTDSLYMPIVENLSSNDGIRLLIAICGLEIDKQRDMEKYKSLSSPPNSLTNHTVNIDCDILNHYNRFNIYDLDQYITLYDIYFKKIFDQFDKSKEKDLSFDKNNIDHRLFITSVSNIRAHIFSINYDTEFKIIEIAGNIVPAVSTTNSIAAGLQVLSVLKFLLRDKSQDNINLSSRIPKRSNTNTNRPSRRSRPSHIYNYIYIRKHPSRKSLIIAPDHSYINKTKCCICNCTYLTLSIDISTYFFHDFVKNIVKEKLEFTAPTISINNLTVYDEDNDGDGDSVILTKVLSKLTETTYIHDGTEIEIFDLDSDHHCTMFIKNQITNGDEGFSIKLHKKYDPTLIPPNSKTDNRDNSTDTTHLSNNNNNNDHKNNNSNDADEDNKPLKRKHPSEITVDLLDDDLSDDVIDID